MRRKNDRVIFAQGFDEIANLDDLQRIEADRWFVQNNDLRISEKRLGNADTLLIALGERGNPAIFDLADSGSLNDLPDLLSKDFSVQPLRLANEGQVVQRCFVHI